MSANSDLAQSKPLGERIYMQQQEVTRLSRLVYDFGRKDQRAALLTAEDQLVRLQAEAVQQGADAAQKAQEARDADTQARQERGVTRGLNTTGLQVTVVSRMDYVPTAYYHLLDKEKSPLVECQLLEVRTTRRLRITAFIEHYSAKAVTTVELHPRNNPKLTVSLLPTLFSDRAREIRELTRASVNVLVEDLVKGQVEEHLTHPIWLLSCNSATFEVQDPHNPDPATRVRNFYPYLGAFVTPNHPRIQSFLRTAAEHHSARQLSGAPEDATAHAAAIYAALQKVTDMVYVNATLAFNPMQGSIGQRVRLPHECLEEKQANCLDGVLLFASLLEAAGQEAAIVLLPNHAVVGWRTGKGAEEWSYLETTMVRTHDFFEAQTEGTELAQLYARQQLQEENTPSGSYFRRLDLRTLRSVEGVMPLA
jgi:hypothetical protein